MTNRPSLPMLLFLTQRAVETRIVEAVREAGFDDMTIPLARIAARIGPEGTRLTEIAAQARVPKQTAAAAIDRLEKAGYIERVPDPSDARARLVILAPRGRATVPIARAEERAIVDEWAQQVGRGRIEELTTTLAALADAVDPGMTTP